MKGKWTTLLDDTPGGLEARRVGAYQVQFIEWTDMDDACGRDNEGQPKYVVELKFVDLEGISSKQLYEAVRSWGYDKEEEGQVILAKHLVGEDFDEKELLLAGEVCQSYGYSAILDSDTSNNLTKSRRAMRSSAKQLLDEDKLEERMKRPVNAIGSTAREMMSGDIFSAMQRGCERGEVNVRLMAKVYGASEDLIDQVDKQSKPRDFLPYLCGYSDGMNSRPKPPKRPKVAPEYHDGYARGERVRDGKAVQPRWIKGGPSAFVVDPTEGN